MNAQALTSRAWWVAAGLALSACGPRELRVTMNSDNNSGQTGFAIITDTAAGLRIELETSVPDVLTPQPAHIHLGTCGEVGLKKFGLLAPAPLEGKPGRFGSVTEVTGASLDDQMAPRSYLNLAGLLAEPHLINVHDSRDPGVYVSCGEIRE